MKSEKNPTQKNKEKDSPHPTHKKSSNNPTTTIIILIRI
jgi:hypothetical protein